MKRISQNKVDKVVVFYKDRLLRVGFELVEQYGIKMHRSLTRIISVIRKKNV